MTPEDITVWRRELEEVKRDIAEIRHTLDTTTMKREERDRLYARLTELTLQRAALERDLAAAQREGSNA